MKVLLCPSLKNNDYLIINASTDKQIYYYNWFVRAGCEYEKK